jgi:uncharacterized protein YwqG
MNEELARLLKPLARPAARLNLKKARGFEELPATGTHFGGKPYFEAGEEWPVCSKCEKPLTFIAQIDPAAGFHRKPVDIGLFTFFYCHDCFPWGLSDEEKGQWAVRFYRSPSFARCTPQQPPSAPEWSTRPCFAAVESVVVYPKWDEIDYWSKEAGEAAERGNDESPWEEYDETVKALGGLTDFATTVGGYACWVQSEEIFDCGICGRRLELLAQIDSESEAGLGWGDAGLVYLFFCREHLEETKLVLQCF